VLAAGVYLMVALGAAAFGDSELIVNLLAAAASARSSGSS
jgi:hypothetical protein